MKILICDGLDEEAVKELQGMGNDVILKKGIPAAELPTLIADADVVVVRSATKITADILGAAKKLKLAIRAGVGIDNIDVMAAQAKGIKVSNTPSATTISVAEHAFGLMLSLARHTPNASQTTKSGKWDKKSFEGTELFGKTVGILGLGRIGQEVAKRAKAFHMNVLAYDHRLDPELVAALEIESEDLETILKTADYISLHLPLDNHTRHLLNASRLSLMKKSAYLINTARGGLIDEEALYNALKSGQLAGAALDVFEKEPAASDHPLFSLPNVIAVPHLGASTLEGQLRAGKEVVRLVRELSA